MGIHYMPTDGGSWTEIPAGDAKYYDSSSGTWKVIKKGYYMPTDGGSWTQFYTGSDPITITMRPNGFSSYPTRFARGSSWGTTSNGPAGGTEGVRTIACGRYFTGANTQRYYGVMNFAFTSNATFLQDELDERPVVSSATLRLTRDTVTHGKSIPGSSTIYISPYNGNTTTSSPNTSDVDLSKRVSASSTGLTRGSDITIDLNQTIIDELASTGNLAITNVSSGLADYGASLDENYLWFFGINNTSDANKQPLITMTLDYT